MKVCVTGLWHLGSVTAACLASAGHDVMGLDFNTERIKQLQNGESPIFEPGLDELLSDGVSSGRLQFSSDLHEALEGAEVIWITYDTPVNEDDHANVEYVVERVIRLFPHIPNNCLMLVSSQVPVGTTKVLEDQFFSSYPEKNMGFAYSPENLRLGNAITTFTQPDRVVVGLRSQEYSDHITELFRPFTDRIERMSVESAEMTKHALNAFLATSVSFINELAVLSEQVGADAKEVERGLKSESRIGPGAYLSPGAAFAGGTLARDVEFLIRLGEQYRQPMYLFSAVKASNDYHKLWVRKKLRYILGTLESRCIALWGLTYKPGTDTLRRSSAVELGIWLSEEGVKVQAFDPAIASLPQDLSGMIELSSSPELALSGASALVVATEWSDFKEIDVEIVISKMLTPTVLDPNRFLVDTLGDDPRIKYASVGKAAI